MTQLAAIPSLAPTGPTMLAVRRIATEDGTDAACDEVVEIKLHLPPGLRYFEGHFPGCPLLPGVVQVKWAVDLGRAHCAALFAAQPRFVSLSNVKFMRVILPESVVDLRLEASCARGRLAYEYRVGGALCSSGAIGFAA